MIVNSYLHFNQISEVIDVPVEALRALNPQYRMDIVPAKSDKPYVLKIPIEQVAAFVDHEQEIYEHKRDEHFPNNEIINPVSRGGHAAAPSDIKGRDKLVYTVKSGDNLGYIADWYRVRVSDLQYWNNINKNLIRVGQKLAVYVPQGQADFYRDVNSMKFADKQAFKSKTPVTTASSSASAPKISVKGGYVYYTVRKGDNLWSIARRFPGVSNDDIIRLNGLTQAGNIQPGQVLKIINKT
jgi:membrane-bound lytic murein transglycosylase D